MSAPRPRVGEWYQNLEGEILEVVAYDRDEEAIEVQFYDGTVEEYDLDTWEELELAPAQPPEDWSGSLDLTADDYGVDLDRPAGDPLPMPVTFRITQVTVKHGDRVEPSAKSTNRLRRQADLRHKHNRLPPVTHDLLNGSNIDLRLTTPGHAMQEERLVVGGGGLRVERRVESVRGSANRGEDTVKHLALIGI